MADQELKPVDKWLKIIGKYDADFKKWTGRVEKILKRYRDDNRSSSSNETARFNILWSNVQTLIPAVFARLPKADVARRYSDSDPVGRVAALLLERTLDYEIEHYTDFRSAMLNSVQDRFLGGRGISWVRYEPHIRVQEGDEQITEDIEPRDETAGSEPKEEIAYECSPTDYVHWKDFGHSVARTWEEVEQGWRWVYLTKDALEARAEKARTPEAKKKWLQCPLDSGPDPLNKYGQKEKNNDRAKICELWDKPSKTVCWLSKSDVGIIETIPDPLGLEGFFPFPKPLYATLTTDSLEPVPDFCLYQDQANELDILSDRIDGLVKALRVRGVYDASVPALQRLLTEGENNTLVPVEHWPGFVEKGGLKGVVDLLPIDTLGAALQMAYQAREDIKGQVYEITGIADIIRGDTAASETATAQEIKGQYAGLRLRSMQDAVALYASELLRLRAQIVCSKYQPETILKYAAADQLADPDKAVIPQAIQLLKSGPLGSFRIEVASDSLVMLDEQQLKTDRVEFLKAYGTFLQQAVPAAQQAPELVPALIGMMKYGATGFKAAKTLEGVLDQALQQLQQSIAQKQANPQPHPDQIKAQADAAMAQAKSQSDERIATVKAQADAAISAAENASKEKIAQTNADAQREVEQMRVNLKTYLEEKKLGQDEDFRRWEAELQASTSIEVALIGATKGAQGEEGGEAANETVTNDLAFHMKQHFDEMKQHHADATARLEAIAKAPKKVVRGPDGRVSQVVPIMEAAE